jgi:adenosylhomocysteinase
VYDVPEKVDKTVAQMKLKALGIKIDELTPQQKQYLVSWEMGT